MGPEIVYVSGRVRPPGEMNGKSGNMNNCLGQIYPKEHRIPGLFDADQVAKKDFFLKTLPFFDAGGSRGSQLHVLCLNVDSILASPYYPMCLCHAGGSSA